MADDAGALLVRSGLISSDDLAAARSACADVGGTIGEHLVAGGLVGDDALTEFYRSRLLVPQVNPNNLARLAAAVVATIPADMAVELRCVPVAMDREGNLTVAMSDPSDRHAVDEISFFTGHYVVRAVATQMQIAWCLAHYYGHVTELGRRLLRPGREAATAPAAARPAPRTKGITGRVHAMRHKVRPPTTPTPSPDAPAAAGPTPTLVGVPAAPVLAGASPIEAPVAAALPPRAVAPALDEGADDLDDDRDDDDDDLVDEDPAPDDDDLGDDDEPEIQIRDLSGPLRDPRLVDTQPTGRAIRTDPPELAARAGEVEVRLPHQPRDLDLPAVVITELAPPPVLIEADGQTSQASPIARPGSEEELAPASEPDDDDQDQDQDQDDDGSDVPSEVADALSAPILLDQRRRPVSEVDDDEPEETTDPGATPAVDDRDDLGDEIDDDELDDDDEANVVLLDRKKPETPPVGRRPERHTQMGIGDVGSRRRRLVRPDQGITQPMIDLLLTAPPEIPTEVDTTVRVPVGLAPAPATAPDLVRRAPWTSGDPLAPAAAPSSPVAAAGDTTVRVGPPRTEPTSGRVVGTATGSSSDNVADGVPRVISDDEDSNTRRVDTRRNRRSSMSMSEIDDGWGPPGTTIPPPYLGAVLGAQEEPSARIPIPSDDDLSGPLLVAPPKPPEERAPRPPRPAKASPAPPPTAPAPVSQSHPTDVSRDLESASTRLVDLVRGLDRAESRDAVIELLVGLIADSHAQAAFFAVRGGDLHPFATRPPAPGASSASLRLDAPSTFQDVVGTRLPYRGPLVDDASRALIINTFGSEPDEVLVIPVAVRDRVVGVLFGAGRMRHTFDEHHGLAARAAGLALERILKAKRAPTSAS